MDRLYRQRYGHVCTALLLLTLCWFPEVLFAGTFTVFGPKTYNRETGEPIVVNSSFSVHNPATDYSIHVYNGGLTNDSLLVSSAVIKLNGQVIIDTDRFNQKIYQISDPVSLLYDNDIGVEVRSKPGSQVAIEIIGVDNEKPTITATVDPSPNSNGWHNSKVAVQFECSDKISGIESCSAPVVLETEGENQVVTGTAIDKAGNTETVSVSLNIDRTSPTLTIVSPTDGALVSNNPPLIELKYGDNNPSSFLTIEANGNEISVDCVSAGDNTQCTPSSELSGLEQSIRVRVTDIADNSTEQSFVFLFDFDNDGVADLGDNCPDTKPGAAVDEFGCSQLQNVINAMVGTWYGPCTNLGGGEYAQEGLVISKTQFFRTYYTASSYDCSSRWLGVRNEYTFSLDDLNNIETTGAALDLTLLHVYVTSLDEEATASLNRFCTKHDFVTGDQSIGDGVQCEGDVSFPNAGDVHFYRVMNTGSAIRLGDKRDIGEANQRAVDLGDYSFEKVMQ